MYGFVTAAMAGGHKPEIRGELLLIVETCYVVYLGQQRHGDDSADARD